MEEKITITFNSSLIKDYTPPSREVINKSDYIMDLYQFTELQKQNSSFYQSKVLETAEYIISLGRGPHLNMSYQPKDIPHIFNNYMGTKIEGAEVFDHNKWFADVTKAVKKLKRTKK